MILESTGSSTNYFTRMNISNTSLYQNQQATTRQTKEPMFLEGITGFKAQANTVYNKKNKVTFITITKHAFVLFTQERTYHNHALLEEPVISCFVIDDIRSVSLSVAIQRLQISVFADTASLARTSQFRYHYVSPMETLSRKIYFHKKYLNILATIILHRVLISTNMSINQGIDIDRDVERSVCVYVCAFLSPSNTP